MVWSVLQKGTICDTATHCNTLQHTATHCNTLQHTATHCNTLQHTAAHCSTLQHTATHCNTLQHTEEKVCTLPLGLLCKWALFTKSCVRSRVCETKRKTDRQIHRQADKRSLCVRHSFIFAALTGFPARSSRLSWLCLTMSDSRPPCLFCLSVFLFFSSSKPKVKG